MNRKMRRQQREWQEKKEFEKTIPGNLFFMKVTKGLISPKKCNKCGCCCKSFRIGIRHEDIIRCPDLINHSTEVSIDELNKLYYDERKCQTSDIIRVIDIKEGTLATCVLYDEEKGCTIHDKKPYDCYRFEPSVFVCHSAKVQHFSNYIAYFKLVSEGTFDVTDAPEDLRYMVRGIMLLLPLIWKYTLVTKNTATFEVDMNMPVPKFIREMMDIPSSVLKVSDIQRIEFLVGLTKMINKSALQSSILFHQQVQLTGKIPQGYLDIRSKNYE